VTEREAEIERLEQQLKVTQEHLNNLSMVGTQSPSTSTHNSRPNSFVSVTSSASDVVMVEEEALQQMVASTDESGE